jgi:PAS domain S-box-containing protein
MLVLSRRKAPQYTDLRKAGKPLNQAIWVLPLVVALVPHTFVRIRSTSAVASPQLRLPEFRMSQDPSHALERRLRAAVESSPSGILMTDAEGRIVLVNREVERLFGYAREELLGKSVDMLVPSYVRASHGTHRRGFLTDPRVRAMGQGRDLFGLRKDGSQVPIEIGLTPVATEEGMFVLSSIVDIGSRKRAEERFRIAVESSPNGMVMIDQAGTVILVNREVERMFGYSRSALLGQPIDKLVPLRFRDRHPIFRADFFHDPRTRAMGVGRDLFGLRKDGAEIPVEIGLNPIETDDGLFVLGSIVDISTRKEAEAERHRLEDQLRQAQKLEAVGTLAGGIAHDFNNLLGAIVGYAELIGEGIKEEGQVREDLRELLKAADRGRQLVEHILTFSRRQDVVRRPIALAGVLQDATKMLRATLPASIEIRLHTHPGVPRVLADSTSVHQILMNLATNSAHAMPSGGTISILLEPFYVRDSMARKRPDMHEGAYALLMVTDTGIGMDAETRNRVFEPFFTTKLPGTGTGLGLAMVHGIMRDHDGAVELESELDHGTTVRCFFPGLLTDSEDVPLTDLIAPRGNGQHVLVVEDEPQLATVGARRLERLGYCAIAETDSRRAVETVRASPDQFDVVVTDLSMPRFDGLAVARELKAIRPDLPVILVTGRADSVTEQEVAAAGVRIVLQKPVTLDQLGEAVHRVVTAQAPGPTSA